MIASVKHVYTNRPADRSGGATPRGGRPECLRETLFSMVHRKHKTNAAPSHYSVRKSAGHLQKRKSDKPGRAHHRQMEHRLVPASRRTPVDLSIPPLWSSRCSYTSHLPRLIAANGKCTKCRTRHKMPHVNNYHKQHVMCLWNVTDSMLLPVNGDLWTTERQPPESPSHYKCFTHWSELQDLWLFPAELFPTKVTVAGCLLVERTFEIQVPRTYSNNTDYNTGITSTLNLPNIVTMCRASPAGLEGQVMQMNKLFM